ncbi:MAG: NADPH:quinone reductase [Pikeienuella sp.]
MKAIWYEEFGPASEVLTIGETSDPTPNAGEVVVRVRATGINPSDVKLRAGARPGSVMEWPRVIPHSDGAGEIVEVGASVDRARIGQRVWIWNGQWRRPFGTGAELIALPADQAVALPDCVSFTDAACFGIPAMTAWYALYADGPIEGKTVLVTGGAGAVGRYACQMARLGGARVITTVSSAEKATHSTCEEWINYRDTDVVEAVQSMTDGKGIDRIVEVDFGANQAASLAMIKDGGAIASYASAADMAPTLNFYPFMFKNTILRMLIVYLLNDAARRKGEAQLTEWLASGKLSHAAVLAGNLSNAASAHDMVMSGSKLGTVVLSAE